MDKKIKAIIVIAFALLLSSLSWADNEENLLERSEESPLGDIIVKHHENDTRDDEHSREIWLVSKAEPKNRFLLFSHGRSAEVLFSPNEQLLVINDYLGSNASDVRLFKRTKGLMFVEVRNAKIFDKARALLLSKYPIIRKLDFGHSYIKAEMWSAHSDAILLSLFGHADTVYDKKYYSLEPWLCVFDVSTMKVSVDLELMNKNVLKY
jgi:hypothetical protein